MDAIHLSRGACPFFGTSAIGARTPPSSRLPVRLDFTGLLLLHEAEAAGKPHIDLGHVEVTSSSTAHMQRGGSSGRSHYQEDTDRYCGRLSATRLARRGKARP